MGRKRLGGRIVNRISMVYFEIYQSSLMYFRTRKAGTNETITNIIFNHRGAFGNRLNRIMIEIVYANSDFRNLLN
jgi:hypothetical protein